VTGGEAHEVKGYEALIELHDVAPDRLLGDKGYDSDAIRDDFYQARHRARDLAAIEPQNADRIRSRSLPAAQSH